VWKAQPACGTGQACLNGACRDTCVQSELEMCPTGQECTGLPQGIQICLPKNGTVDAGTPPPPPPPPPADAGTGTGGTPKLVPADDPPVDPNQQISSGSGCGCTSGAAVGPCALLGLLALARTRLRRRG
jgi:hypothetical protein